MNLDKNIYILTISLRGGGAERQIAYLLSQYKNSKAILLEKGCAYDVTESQLVYIDSENMFSWSKVLKIPIYVYKIIKIIRKNQDAILLSFMDTPNFINYCLSFFVKNKIIVSVRTNLNVRNSGLLKRVYLKLLIAIYKNCRNIVVNSNGSAETLESFGIKNHQISVIPNMYDSNEISIRSQLHEINEWNSVLKHQCIVCIGNLRPVKGHKHLIKIFAELKQSNPNIKLIFLGVGELKNKLIELIQNYNLSHYDCDVDNKLNDTRDIYFAGFQPNVYWFARKAYLSILISYHEGLPNVIIESLMSEAFCVAADCKSGPREILAPDTSLSKTAQEVEYAKYGVLLPPFYQTITKKEEEKLMHIWVTALKDVLNNNDLVIEYKRRATDRIKAFDIENIICKWDELFEKTN